MFWCAWLIWQWLNYEEKIERKVKDTHSRSSPIKSSSYPSTSTTSTSTTTTTPTIQIQRQKCKCEPSKLKFSHYYFFVTRLLSSFYLQLLLFEHLQSPPVNYCCCNNYYYYFCYVDNISFSTSDWWWLWLLLLYRQAWLSLDNTLHFVSMMLMMAFSSVVEYSFVFIHFLFIILIAYNHDGDDISMIYKEEMKDKLYPGFTVASLAKASSLFHEGTVFVN